LQGKSHLLVSEFVFSNQTPLDVSCRAQVMVLH